MKGIILALLCMSLFVLAAVLETGTVAAMDSWYSHKSLKITIETENIYYEWEYENPNSFEYEEGNSIVRGTKAKESFEELLTVFDLSKDVIDDEQIAILGGKGYKSIKRVAIKRVDRNECMQTWIWKK